MRKQLAMLLVVVACGAAPYAAETVGPQTPPTARGDTVYVAAPTGDQAADRANIVAALTGVGPGGTVQFAPGTYLVGAIISVTVPRVTLSGHPDGTTLRGCDPAELVDESSMRERCNGLELGSRQRECSRASDSRLASPAWH